VPEANRFRDTGANCQFAIAAAKQALDDAQVLDDRHIDRSRFGIYLGSGEGIQDFHHLVSLVARSYQPAARAVDAATFTRNGLKEFHAGREFEQEPHATPAHIADLFGLDGPNYNCLTA